MVHIQKFAKLQMDYKQTGICLKYAFDANTIMCVCFHFPCPVQGPINIACIRQQMVNMLSYNLRSSFCQGKQRFPIYLCSVSLLIDGRSSKHYILLCQMKYSTITIKRVYGNAWPRRNVSPYMLLHLQPKHRMYKYKSF